MRYLNFATFDILGDLCFADSFGALKTEAFGPWVNSVFKALKMTRMFRVLRSYTVFGVPFYWLLKLFLGMMRARQRHEMYTVNNMDKRIDTATDRKDFMRCVDRCLWNNEELTLSYSYIIKHNGDKGMTIMK
jgi:hypothetical protein